MLVQLSIPSLARMRAAKNFSDLWHSLNNDEGFELRHLYQEATDHALEFKFEHGTDEDWEKMHELYNTLERVVDIFNDKLSDSRSEEEINYSQLEEAVWEGLEVDTGFNKVVVDAALSQLRESSFYEQDCPLIRATTVPNPSALDERKFNVFISYRTRDYLLQARQLADDLVRHGLRVWLDEQVIGDLRGGKVVKEDLSRILNNAVANSACTIVFNTAMSVAENPPWMTDEEALASGHVMHGPDGNLISWDWQVKEIMASTRGLAIHDQFIALFDYSGMAHVKWISLRAEEKIIDGVIRGLKMLNVC
ncbi:MAG: TIR domain-containing protein [Leptolyngbya sp. SIO4C1]|nr:TIR domain-containing protein [Leptolyngbya sp. SIO4C1]